MPAPGQVGPHRVLEGAEAGQAGLDEVVQQRQGLCPRDRPGEVVQAAGVPGEVPAHHVRRPSERLVRLSEREREVLEYVIGGSMNKVIADALGVAMLFTKMRHFRH